jgi:hypothetical protein
VGVVCFRSVEAHLSPRYLVSPVQPFITLLLDRREKPHTTPRTQAQHTHTHTTPTYHTHTTHITHAQHAHALVHCRMFCRTEFGTQQLDSFIEGGERGGRERVCAPRKESYKGAHIRTKRNRKLAKRRRRRRRQSCKGAHNREREGERKTPQQRKLFTFFGSHHTSNALRARLTTDAKWSDTAVCALTAAAGMRAAVFGMV